MVAVLEGLHTITDLHVFENGGIVIDELNDVAPGGWLIRQVHYNPIPWSQPGLLYHLR
jgi:hypothetical protein